MKGSYVLLAKVSRDFSVNVGVLGNVLFEKGLYAYIGSAMNSLEKRIERHLRDDKKMHWHIDYLLASPDVSVESAFFKESCRKEECETARKMAGLGEGVKGFGCSDCRCESHLFKVEQSTMIKLKGFRVFA